MKGGNGTSKVTQGVKGKRLISSFKRLHGGIQLQNGALKIRCLRARRVVASSTEATPLTLHPQYQLSGTGVNQ